MIGVSEFGIIRNAIFENANVISTDNDTGALVGIARKNTLVYNCSATGGSVSNGMYTADVLVGWAIIRY